MVTAVNLEVFRVVSAWLLCFLEKFWLFKIIVSLLEISLKRFIQDLRRRGKGADRAMAPFPVLDCLQMRNVTLHMISGIKVIAHSKHA